jgi:catechol 2,3-dioxygenase-like lactoylglutathione lyase family enzyme
MARNDRGGTMRLALAAVFCLAALSAAVVSEAALPDAYKGVSSIHWVVSDLEAVRQGWHKLGFPVVESYGDVYLPKVEIGGQTTSASIRAALASFAGLDVVWIQPVGSPNPYADFLARKGGGGVFSLNHNFLTLAALDAEVARLNTLGVQTLSRTTIETGYEPLTIVYMDTLAEGKYVLGLIHGSMPTSGVVAPPTAPPDVKLSQFAFVVNDMQAVSAYWARLGFPAFEASHGLLWDRVYRGQPGAFEQELGFQHHGSTAYEWIRVLKGPTVYADALKAHGEGFHHLAFDVKDIDKAVAEWTARGAVVVQSGGWGEKGKAGSGRFAYLDTDAFGGILVELLWSQP